MKQFTVWYQPWMSVQKQANLFAFYQKAKRTIEEGLDGKEIFQDRDERGDVCSIHPETVSTLYEKQARFDKIYNQVCEKLHVSPKHEGVGRPTRLAEKYRDSASKIATKIVTMTDTNRTGDSFVSSESSQSSTLCGMTDEDLITQELANFQSENEHLSGNSSTASIPLTDR